MFLHFFRNVFYILVQEWQSHCNIGGGGGASLKQVGVQRKKEDLYGLQILYC